MPIIRSAKKALRQNIKHKKRNLARKASVRTARKDYIKSQSADKLRVLYKALDKAAKTHAIAKNKASRLKSRLAKRLSKQK